jgi:predicted HNH restriction endonuclease
MKIETTDLRDFLPKYTLFNNGKVFLETPDKKKEVIHGASHNHLETFLEGSKEIYKEKRLKRSSSLRVKAIELYKLDCYVCGFNFEAMYGLYGDGYIEIHHLMLLADSMNEQNTKLSEVRVVCSNCHSVLHHQGRTPMDIDELKNFVQARISRSIKKSS